MKNIKEGAWGKKEPGYEYVIWDASKEGVAPILGIRSTYDEALSLQLRLMKTGKYENISFDRVPKGKFVKGDDFWGPFDDDWNLIEASSAEKKAYKNGGKELDDYVQGKAIARIKDPEARDAAVALAKAGNSKVDRFVGDRKVDQAERSFEKKADKMQKAGIKEELEAGDCAYHPEKDEYFYLKKTNKPNTFELYTHSDSRGFEIASPRFIDKNSPFYNKLKLTTKNANPEFKELHEKVEYIEMPHEVYETPEDIRRINDELDAKAKAGKLVGIRKEKKMLQLAEPEINGIWTIFLNDEGFIEKIVLF